MWKDFYSREILSRMNCIRIIDSGNLLSCYFADGSFLEGSILRAYTLLEVNFYPFSGSRYTSGKAKGGGQRYRLYYSTYLNQNFESIQFYGNVNIRSFYLKFATFPALRVFYIMKGEGS